MGLAARVSFMLLMRFWERQMNVMLIVALVTACMVNMACVLVHL